MMMRHNLHRILTYSLWMWHTICWVCVVCVSHGFCRICDGIILDLYLLLIVCGGAIYSMWWEIDDHSYAWVGKKWFKDYCRMLQVNFSPNQKASRVSEFFSDMLVNYHKISVADLNMVSIFPVRHWNSMSNILICHRTVTKIWWQNTIWHLFFSSITKLWCQFKRSDTNISVVGQALIFVTVTHVSWPLSSHSLSVAISQRNQSPKSYSDQFDTV